MEKYNDQISRQTAIKALDSEKFDGAFCCEYEVGYNDGIDFAISTISALSSVQPDKPEWVESVERWYNKALCKPYIKNPLAWALYQTWKEYDNG